MELDHYFGYSLGAVALSPFNEQILIFGGSKRFNKHEPLPEKNKFDFIELKILHLKAKAFKSKTNT